MPREVTWPLLLRPPVLRLPSVSALTGLPFQSDDLSTRMRPRCDEVVGLYCLSAIASVRSLASDTGGDVDRLALGQRHDRFLDVRARIGTAPPALGLALRRDRVDPGHVDSEQRLDGGLDLRLAGAARDLEDDGVVLGQQGQIGSASCRERV